MKRIVLLCMLALCANLLSFLLFLHFSNGPVPALERYPVLDQDSSVYATLANNLLAHHVFSDSPTLAPYRFYPIGYPLFLAITKFISGSFLVAVALQVLLSIIAAVLVYRMARRLLPEHLALIPALLFACDPYLLFLNTSVLTDSLFTSLVVIVMYGLFFWDTKQRLWQLLGMGALLGAAVLVRPIGEFLILLLPLGYWYYFRPTWPQAWRLLGVFAVGFLVVTGPWIARNALTFGKAEIAHVGDYNLLYYDAQDFLVLKALRLEQAEPELWSLVNLHTTQAQDISQQINTKISTDLAQLTPQGKDPADYYAPLAEHYILQDPAGYTYFHLANIPSFFLEGDIRGYMTMLRSVANRNGFDMPTPQLFGAVSVLRNREVPLPQKIRAAGALGVPLVEMAWRALLVLFAIVALVLAPPRARRILWVFAVLIAYFAVLTGPVAAGTPRYHLPAEPYLLILAITGGYYVWQAIARRHARPSQPQ